MADNFNGVFGYAPQNYVGFGVNQQAVIPKGSNPLTEEEIKELQKLINPQTSIKPTPLEQFQGICSHYYPNGAPAFNMNAAGQKTCQLCGTVVDFEDCPSQEEAEAITARFTNLMEIAKFCSLDMPSAAKRQYFGNTVPFIKKLPLIWKSNAEKIQKISQPAVPYNYQNSQGFGLFAAANNAYVPGFNAPQMAPMYGQPNVMGQPAPMPFGQQPAAPNPFMAQPTYNQPQMAPMYGQPQGFGYQQPQGFGYPTGVNAQFNNGYMQPGMDAPAAPAEAAVSDPATTASTVKQGNV